MTQYFLKRLLVIAPTFLGITLMTFIVVNLAPGGPIEKTLREIRFGAAQAGVFSASEITNQGVSEEVLSQLRQQFGFDKPLPVRYFIWLGRLLRLDFGTSFVHDEPVLNVIASKFPISLMFGITSLLLTYLICIPLGVLKAVRDGSWFDSSSSMLVFAGYATPSLMLGILLIVLFGGGSFFNWFPISGTVSDLHDTFGFTQRIWDRIHHAILPLISYLAGNFATLTLLMKNSYLEELQKPYVTTARAKGLSEITVRYRHVLRNALIPIVTGLGSFLGVFFVGNLFIEQIFTLDGMGLLFYNSLLARDYPVILGLLSLISIILLIGNVISDFFYVLVDPRIDFGK